MNQNLSNEGVGARFCTFRAVDLEPRNVGDAVVLVSDSTVGPPRLSDSLALAGLLISVDGDLAVVQVAGVATFRISEEARRKGVHVGEAVRAVEGGAVESSWNGAFACRGIILARRGDSVEVLL